MADSDDSLLNKAESLARRLLERIGSNVDDAGSQNEQRLSLRRVGEITSQIEKAIETNLREDQKGVKRISPSSFDVLLTYEEASQLNTKYIEALAVELKASVYEYINNRRYETSAPISVSVRSDLFAKHLVIKTTFDAESANIKKGAAGSSFDKATSNQSTRTLTLRADSGVEYHITLKAQGDSHYIGRGAGLAVKIDDASVSRLHCSLALRGSEIIISDLGSANGTTVNGREVGQGECVSIQQGDVIEVGDVHFKVIESS